MSESDVRAVLASAILRRHAVSITLDDGVTYLADPLSLEGDVLWLWNEDAGRAERWPLARMRDVQDLGRSLQALGGRVTPHGRAYPSSGLGAN